MYRFLSSILTGILCLGLFSCSSDEPSSGGEDYTTFTLKLSKGMNTKAFGDNVNVNTLEYALYSEDGQTLLDNNVIPSAFSDGVSQNVSLKLVNGEKYKVIFYASNSDNDAYEFTPSTGNFSVDYSKVVPNDIKYDAFYSVSEVTGGSSSATVTLTRPFAQINIGTDDIDSEIVENAGGIGFYGGKITVASGILSGINLLTGETQSQETSVSWDISSFNNLAKGEYPVSGYETLDMNYLLVSFKEEISVNMTYDVMKNGSRLRTLNLKGVPLQTNYRTNIFGSILTTDGDVTITVTPSGGEIPDNAVEIRTPEQFLTASAGNSPMYIPADADINMSLIDKSGMGNSTIPGLNTAKVLTMSAPELIVDGRLSNLDFVMLFNKDVKIYSPNKSGIINVVASESSDSKILISGDFEDVPTTKSYDGTFVQSASISDITISGAAKVEPLAVFAVKDFTMNSVTLNAEESSGMELYICDKVEITDCSFKTSGSNFSCIDLNTGQNVSFTGCVFMAEYVPLAYSNMIDATVATGVHSIDKTTIISKLAAAMSVDFRNYPTLSAQNLLIVLSESYLYSGKADSPVAFDSQFAGNSNKFSVTFADVFANGSLLCNGVQLKDITVTDLASNTEAFGQIWNTNFKVDGKAAYTI